MRPLGVSLVAAWYWIRGAGWAFLGLGIFVFAKLVGGLLASMPSWLSAVWHSLGVGFAAVMILLALLDFAVGGGLLGLKAWAANIAIGLCSLHLLLAAGSIFGHLHPLAAIGIAINAASVVYLLLPAVRTRFQ